MRAAGFTLAEVGAHFGVSNKTVWTWVNDPTGERSREWRRVREDDPEYMERQREYQRTYYARNAEARCASSNAWKRRNREHVALYARLRRYGLTREEFEEMRARQAGACAACGGSMAGPRNEHIDHCHETGRVRALLCYRCNITLGMVQEDADRLRALAGYVEKESVA